MGRAVANQVNFNTILLLILGALVTLGIRKADAAFTSVTRLEVQQADIARRVENIEIAIGMIKINTNGRNQVP